MKPSSCLTRVRVRLGAFAVVLAAALLLALSGPAWAEGSLFGGLFGKASAGGAQSEPSGVRLNKTAFSVQAGEFRQLRVVEGAPEEGNSAFDWTSSNPEVAEVDASGQVRALSKGTATVTATLADQGGASASCEVTVVNNRVETAAPVLFASDHDYTNGCSDVWVYSNQYVYAVRIAFGESTYVERGFDFIEVRNAEGALVGRYTGDELSDCELWIDGTGFSIVLLSDEENTNWGFALYEFEPQYREGWVDDGTNVYYIVNGERVTGLQQIDGVWHWFDPATGAWGEKPGDVAVSADPVEVAGVQVPNLTGMTLWDARDYLATLGLGCDDQWTLESDAPYGTIVTQEPGAYAWLEPGGGVLVTVSSGPQEPAATVTVPQLVDMWWWDAEALLDSLGLYANITWVYDENVEAGLVAWQSPWNTNVVEVGSTVDLVVSEGPEYTPDTYMYDYSGWWYSSAIFELTNQGFYVVVDESLTAFDASQEGVVWGTEPAAGSPMSYGDSVILYIYGAMSGEPFVSG